MRTWFLGAVALFCVPALGAAQSLPSRSSLPNIGAGRITSAARGRTTDESIVASIEARWRLGRFWRVK